MSDSVFVVVDPSALPAPVEIQARADALGLGIMFDTDWRWHDFEGWIPARYLDEECGFEITTDTVEDNQQFAVEGRPDLRCLLELTVRGGMHSYAVTYAFAGIVVELADGELNLDEDENIRGKDAREWVVETLQELETGIERQANKKLAFEEARKSGRAPGELLQDALQRFVGEKIGWYGVELGFRAGDHSMVFGARCEISQGENVLIQHGLASKLNDEMTRLVNRYLPNATDSQLEEISELQERLVAAKAKDESIRDDAYAIMNDWIDAVSVIAVELCEDNSIKFELTDEFQVRYTTEGIFSTIHVITDGVKYVVTPGEIKLTQGA